MRIAVAGGTGVAGRFTVDSVRALGHDAVSLSRRDGVDVRTGTGVADALAGVDVVVDTLNIGTTDRRRATDFFVESARTLQARCAAAGVQRIMVLSIVGVDRVTGLGYYAAKMAHEEAHRNGSVPVSVVRATQFHEFGGQVLGTASIGPVSLVPSMRIRPVAARSVGHHLAAAAVAAAAGSGADLHGPTVTEVAGPEEIALVDLARRTVRLRGGRRVVVPIPVPGAAGRALRGGALLPGPEALITGPGPGDWLASQDCPPG